MYKYNDEEVQELVNNIIRKVPIYIQVYINDSNIAIDPNYISEFEIKHYLFENEKFELGATPSKQIDIKLYKDININNINNINKIKVDGYFFGYEERTKFAIGVFEVDNINTEDEAFIKLTGLDYMNKLNEKYDYSKLIDEDAGEYPTLSQIVNDICITYNIENSNVPFINQNTKAMVYDSNLTAREVLSYISELAGGFAYIGRDGKLYIKSYFDDEIEDTLYYENFKDISVGKKYYINKVRYEDGVQLYSSEFDENYQSNATDDDLAIYIKQENLYIYENSQIMNIAEKLYHKSFYSMEGTIFANPLYDIGDIIKLKYTDDSKNIEDKFIIYSGDMTIGGYKTLINIKSEINGETVEETTKKVLSEKELIRRVQSTIDQQKGEIELLARQKENESEKLSQLLIDMEQISLKVEKGGGSNLLKNSVMFANHEGEVDSWNIEEDGQIEIKSDVESLQYGGVSGNSIILDNKTISQEIKVALSDTENPIYYTFSVLIKMIATQSCNIRIYNELEEYEIDIPNGQNINYGTYAIEKIKPLQPYYRLEISGSGTFTDLMFGVGTSKQEWIQASGETMNAKVVVNENGLIVKSDIYDGDYTAITPMEFSGYSNEDGEIEKVFTINKGTTQVKRLEANEEFKITPLKIVAVTTGEKQGWAFIPTTGGENE